MKAAFGHIQFNIDPENFQFYKELFPFLGWKIVHESEEMLGVGYSNGNSMWFANRTVDVNNNYDGTGMNHIAFHTETIEDVDRTVSYLNSKNVLPLFETPRHRPEFSGSVNDTYYQVMFETPDQILVEVVYIGPK